MSSPEPYRNDPSSSLAAICHRMVRRDLERMGVAADEAEMSGRSAVLRHAFAAVAPASADDTALARMALQLERMQADAPPEAGPVLPQTIGRHLRDSGRHCPPWMRLSQGPRESPPARQPAPGTRVRYVADPLDVEVRGTPERVVGRVVGPVPGLPGYARVLDGRGDTWSAAVERCESLPEVVDVVGRVVLPPREAFPAPGGATLLDVPFDGGVRFAVAVEPVPEGGTFPSPVAFVGVLIDAAASPPRLVLRFGAMPSPVGIYVCGLDNTRYAVTLVEVADAPDPPRVISALALTPDAWAPNPGDPWPPQS